MTAAAATRVALARDAAALATGTLALALYATMSTPWAVLGWVVLAPWLVVLDRTPTLARTLGRALVMAILFVIAAFGWFARALEAYTGIPWIAALLLLAATAPLIQPQLLVFAIARHVAAHRAGGGRALVATVGACAWVGTEWLWPKLFGDTLGHGLYPARWLRQGADLAGAPGLTFVLLLANESVVALWYAARAGGGARPRWRRVAPPAAVIATLVLLLSAYGALRLRALATLPATPWLTAGIVQPGISHYDRLAAEVGTFAAVRAILDTHRALSTEVLARADLDLLVWPETVYPTTFGTPKSPDGAAFDREIAAFVARADVPLVFGAYDTDGRQEFNAAIVLEPARDGPLTFDSYRKATLFPLTERVPAWLDSPRLRRWLPWLGTWQPGPGAQVLTVGRRDGPPIRIAPLICYDVLDPRHALGAVRRGAELIVTLSNDSWFAGPRGPRQHLVGAAFRSMETRRPQLRATNTGISAVIAPSGDVTTMLDVGVRASVVATLAAPPEGATLIVQRGEWLGPVALVGGLALCALGRRWRSGGPPAF